MTLLLLDEVPDEQDDQPASASDGDEAQVHEQSEQVSEHNGLLVVGCHYTPCFSRELRPHVRGLVRALYLAEVGGLSGSRLVQAVDGGLEVLVRLVVVVELHGADDSEGTDGELDELVHNVSCRW